MHDSSFKNYRFEDLEVWQLGIKIVGEVYNLAKKFPKEELFALSDQLKRASTSIVLNIAEGSGQSTPKSFALYLNRSKSSLLESVACIKIAIQQGFVNKKETEDLDKLFREEYFKIIALEKSVNNK